MLKAKGWKLKAKRLETKDQKCKLLFFMTEEIIIAGFGGQGVLSMGKILAYSGIMQDQEVSWMPSYGPEMRGGTANVTVIISDERISSPVLNAFDSAIVLNQQSMDKFEPLVKQAEP